MDHKYSHAEGYMTTASGTYSYAEGFSNLANAAGKIGASMEQVASALQGLINTGGNDYYDSLKELAEYTTKITPKDIGFTLQEVDMSGFDPVELTPIGLDINGATNEPEAAKESSAAHSSNKLYKTRITLRYDTLENWESNPDFIPLRGEVCIIESPYESWRYRERYIVIGNGESTLLSMYDDRHFITI